MAYPPHYEDHCAKRETYKSENTEAGRQLEEDGITKNFTFRFINLHAPMDVLRKYAEIPNLRITLKV